MMKKIFLLLLIIQNFIVLSENIDTDSEKPLKSAYNEQMHKQTDSSPDPLLEQHLRSLDSQIGVLYAVGLMSGFVATFALATKNKDVAKCLGGVTAISIIGGLYYSSKKESLIMQRFNIDKK